MNRLQKSGAALFAALWLTSCSHVSDGRVDVGRADAVDSQDTAVVIINPGNGPLPTPNDSSTSLLDLGMLDQRGGANTAPSAGGCDEDLPNDLVTREIYRRLNAGDTFHESLEKQRAKPGEVTTEPPIQERIRAYRSERRAFYEDLFACREGNEEIHDLARSLAANPNNRAAFSELFVALVEQRGDEVLSHYTAEDFNKYADMILDWGLFNLRLNITDLDDYVERDAVVARIHERVEQAQEELSVHALKSELVNIFQSQSGLPMSVKTDLHKSLEQIVSQELVSHIREQLNQRMTMQHTLTTKFEM